MSDYLIAPLARNDLIALWKYYALEVGDLALADRMRDEIFAAISLLVKTPGMGHFRNDLASEPVRFWRVRNHLIIYRTKNEPLEIVRVLLGARDVKELIGSLPP